tara:strand:+ start:193 stop:393 length:201 start_codon:yes stop_codon:yes gene_type:complete
MARGVSFAADVHQIYNSISPGTEYRDRRVQTVAKLLQQRKYVTAFKHTQLLANNSRRDMDSFLKVL